MKRSLFTLFIATLYTSSLFAQALEQNVEERLSEFFSNYQTSRKVMIDEGQLLGVRH